MNVQERFHATCAFEMVDRPIRYETIGFWKETYARWHKEGLSEAINDDIFSAPEYFGFDPQRWLPITPDPTIEPGFWPRFEEEILEEEETYVIKRDNGGNTIKAFTDGHSTIPHIIESPVKTMRDFEEIKWRLDPENPERFSGFLDLMIGYANATTDKYTNIILCGLFGTFRNLMGLKGISIAMRRDPALVHAIARQWVCMHSTLIKRISARVPVDWIYFWEDMSYKNGPIISPSAFKEFMSPYYKELIDSLKADTEIRIFGVDSDGDVWLLIPLFIEVGVNFMLPFEVNAGMDIRRVRETFGNKLTIMGGLDKLALARDVDALRSEVLEKVPFMLASGGYIPALDHAVPPEVPLKHFEYFLEMVRSLA